MRWTDRVFAHVNVCKKVCISIYTYDAPTHTRMHMSSYVYLPVEFSCSDFFGLGITASCSQAQATLAAHTAKSPMTMHDLEEHRASQLLRSMARKDTAGHRSRRPTSKESPARSASQTIKTGQKAAVLPEDADASEPSVPSMKKKALTMNSRLLSLPSLHRKIFFQVFSLAY